MAQHCVQLSSRVALRSGGVGARIPIPRCAKLAPAMYVRKGAVAYTNWMLDGVGCASARSGDDRLIAHSKNAARCPVAPISITTLCESHSNEFTIDDARFEMVDDQLFVSNVSPLALANERGVYVDGEFVPPFGVTALRPGAHIEIAHQEYEVLRNVHAHA